MLAQMEYRHSSLTRLPAVSGEYLLLMGPKVWLAECLRVARPD